MFNFLLVIASFLSITSASVLNYVDTFIGSGGAGFGAGSHNPGVQIPFGILRLGPDTTKTIPLPFNHYGGYHYKDKSIVAFSHTHLVGAGVGDLGNFGLIPFATSNKNLSTLIKHHNLPLDHTQETSSPGQYAINLKNVANVTLTASGTHSGSHQYVFQSKETTCGVLLDVCHTAMGDGFKTCKNATVNVSNSTENYMEITASMKMAGSLTKRSNQKGVKLYFVAHLNHTGLQTKTWGNGDGSKGVMLSAQCNTLNQHALHLNVAISFISIKHARLNLILQSHSDSQNSSYSQWNTLLSRFTVQDSSNDTSLKTKFYTAIYHTYLAPSIYEESNGNYLSFDQHQNSTTATIRTVGDEPGDKRKHAYTDMSIWDIHRTQLPWLSLTLPETFTDILSSLQFMAMQGTGDIPKWPLLNIYGSCMVGSHAWPTIAEAVTKNQTNGLNMTWIYNSMKRGATTTRPRNSRVAVDKYTTLGYVPSEESKQSASLTLAYAFDDNAVATVAKTLGFHEEAAIFYNRARAAYKQLWDPNRELLCPKSFQTKQTKCPLDSVLPYPFETTYVEGDALQWLWFVPHDPEGLVKLFKNSEQFVAKLDSFFVDGMSIKNGGKWAGGTVLANAWYWPGNEPDILAPYMFPFAGAKYQNYTVKWTKWIVDNAYGTQSNGLPGNDDFGTLSAWMSWSMLGFYPLAGSSRFVVGAPRFDKICIQREVGELCVIGHNVNKIGFTHVNKCVLNGNVLLEPFFDFKDIGTGISTLEFNMSDVEGIWG